jgi:GNAT superfamily N-acetyltransferase
MICPVAVLEHVRVDEDVRRRGYGRALLAAARARYDWRQTTITATPSRRGRSGPLSAPLDPPRPPTART